MTFGKEGEADDASSSPGFGVDTVVEEGQRRSPTPAPDSEIPTVRKRKSGTFWRRKSSLGMASALDTDGNTLSKQNVVTNGATNGAVHGGLNGTNGSLAGVEELQNGMHGGHETGTINGGSGNEEPLPDLGMVPTRSWSPPPQLPAFIGGGGGLGGEDLFKDIH